MAAVRHLEFKKLKMLTSGPVQMPNMRDFAKFRKDTLNRRHLGFWKFQIINGCDAQEGRTASACQILSKSLKSRLRYGDFSIFHDGGRPPSWIVKSWKFQLKVPFGGPICVIVPNSAKTGRTVPEILPIFDFSRWRPPPSWILEISNF